MSGKKEAIDHVKDFAARKGVQAFTQMHREDVASGLLERIERPDLIYQGKRGFCVPAEMVYNLAHHKPVNYAQLVTDLFEFGRGWLGQDLLEPGYFVKHHALTDEGEDEADWIPMVSIRDCENFFFSFLVDHAFGKDGMSLAEEASVYTKAGYTDVKMDTDRTLPSLIDAERKFQQGYNVGLSIDSALLYVASAPDPKHAHHFINIPDPKHPIQGKHDHRVALATRTDGEKAIHFDKHHESLRMTVFTWKSIRHVPHDQDHPKQGHHWMTIPFFLKYYYGNVACKM